MKVLFLSTPRVVFSKSLNNRATDFGETIAYIKNKFSDEEVEINILDASAPSQITKKIYKEFSHNFDLVIFYADISDSPMVLKMARRLKFVSPNTKIFAYGDGTIGIPQFFEREPFDAFHICGDQEYAVYSYISYLLNGEDESFLAGVKLRINHEYRAYDKTVWINSNEWAFPPIDILPIDQYNQFSMLNKGKRYCISVYASKGCSRNCKYCMCVPREGLQDRRRSVKSLVDFMVKHKEKTDEYKLHSANLFADREWTMDFANEIICRGIELKWRATTEFYTLDEELVRLVVKAGCSQISFGVETFYKDRRRGYKIHERDVHELMSSIVDLNVRMKGYIMLGIENQTIEDVEHTINFMDKYNIAIRPAVYTPFHILKDMSCEELDKLGLENWNKKEFINYEMKNSLNEREIYRMLNYIMFRDEMEVAVDSL